MLVSQKHLLILLSFMLAFFGKANGQGLQGVEWDHSYYQPMDEIVVGDEITLVFKANIDPGYHIYSVEQSFPGLGTTFDLDKGAKGTRTEGKLLEEGKRKTLFDELFEAEVSQFEENATFYQKLKITSPQPRLKGFIRYQVCDETGCIPGTYEVDIPLRTSRVKAREERIASERSDSLIRAEISTVSARPAPAAFLPLADESLDISQIQNLESANRALDSLFKRVSSRAKDKRPLVVWAHNLIPNKNLHLGDTITLFMHAKMAPGYHIFSVRPPARKANKPTSIALGGNATDIEIVGDLLEKGKRKRQIDPFFDTYLRYFKSEVIFFQNFVIKGPNPVVSGALNYQLADSMAAKEGAYQFTINLSDKVKLRPEDLEPATLAFDPDQEIIEQKGFFGLLWAGILFGLSILLTPSVLPLGILTIMLFASQDEAKRWFRRAIMFATGVVLMYLLLASIFSPLAGASFLPRLASNPILNLVLFILISLLGWDYLGGFERRPTPKLISRFIKEDSFIQGNGALLLMVLSVAFMAFGANGVFVEETLFNLSGESFGKGFISTLGIAVGLSIPFGIFSLIPAWLGSRFKEAHSLNFVRGALGFLALAMALPFLRKVSVAWNLDILNRSSFIGAWIALSVILGIYWLGLLRLPYQEGEEDDAPYLSVRRLLLAAGTFWFALYLLPGMWGAPLQMMTPFLPPITEDVGVVFQGRAVPPNPENHDICSYTNKENEHLEAFTPLGFCSFYNLDDALEYAKMKKRPILMNFTGQNCDDCRYIEQEIWANPVITRHISEDYVLVSLFTDDRKNGEQWRQMQEKRYQTNARPCIVLLTPDGKELAPPLKYTNDVGRYRKYLEYGLQVYSQQQALKGEK